LVAAATASAAAFLYAKHKRRRRRSTATKDEHKLEVSFDSADQSFRLYGNLYLPASTKDAPSQAKLPAIVIVAGSGPIDRDGNAKGFFTGIQLNTSNRFAEHMMMMMMMRTDDSQQQIAVLTYDKRGVGKSTGRTHDDKHLLDRAGMMDLVSDAVEAVRFLQHHPRIDPTRIVVMGHSEGAIVMPLICQNIATAAAAAAAEDKDGLLSPVKGAIFLAGFGENLFDAVRFQQENTIREVHEAKGLKGWILRKLVTKKKVHKQFADLMKKVESGAADDAAPPDYVNMYCGLVTIPAKWFREHKSFNEAQAQAALAAHMSCHCLAITGQKDVQVRNEFCVPATAQALVPNAASIESHRPPNLTHILRSLEGPAGILSVKEDYPRLGKLPLDPELLSLIGAWCDRVLAV
jgi:pimeloyl-ACP methyl ester carboxylesterase